MQEEVYNSLLNRDTSFLVSRKLMSTDEKKSHLKKNIVMRERGSSTTVAVVEYAG